MSVRIIAGDCRDVLRTLPEASVDSVVTDPPYHLTQASRGGHARTNNPDMPHGRHRIGDKGFMGKQWDGGDVAFRAETWVEVLRVLKPGGHLVAFGGTRTYHRMVCAIEDAGFEIRDQLGWVYGSGFPKSRNLGGEWKGWGTALKPAWEPIVLARKSLVGTVEANVHAHGTGALNIDGCRIPADDEAYARNHSGDRGHGGTRSIDDTGATSMRPGGGNASATGRWPANILHDGSEEVMAAFPQASGAVAPVTNRNADGDATRNAYGKYRGGRATSDQRDGGGSAARFFYCAKADRADRNAGLDGMPERPLLWSSGEQNPGAFQSSNTKRAAQNNHPTVKPTDLMRWLCRLITPPGGIVLDPFAGSGSTLKAAEMEGFSAIGVELEAEYIEIARRRIASDAPLFAEVA